MHEMKRSLSDRSFSLINGFLLIMFFLLCIYPFYYVLIYSLSNPSEAQKGITLFPRGFTFNNYVRVFQLEGMFTSAFVSLLRTICGTAITIVCCSFFAYLVSKQEMCGRKIVYRFLVITMYFNSGLIPWYLTMKTYHLNNSFLLYIIPSAISAYYIVLLKTFIEQMPQSLEESAKLDGAGYFMIFRKVIFPLSKPIIATIAVFAAVGQWNSWFDNYILVQNDQLKTLQLVLYEYLNKASSIAQQTDKTHGVVIQITPQAVRMTITTVVTIPILFVYPFMQKYFVKGIMLGAIKG
ncbi:MAG: carbohydrate ABC transporter permease [Clostridiaceae bacterium]|nr:carbohydrate ABC transporter permease [Clostridiaceae bacterium]